MAARLGVAREVTAGETRVALVPAVAERYAALGLEVLLERGAGLASHYPDDDYTAAELVDDAAAAFAADLVLTVRPPAPDRVALLREGAVLVGLLDPYREADTVRALAERGVTSFALELLPRISRAQAMDALTSQASVAGYKAV
ncbi:MAG: NAD(P)(+) transhydrogenase (Re/Si-specific) subunit alpha, partial [Thermoleophilia bacterium]|nr:NAD(P)(+) transhydrogenase (Re/Si-specific) subunit alpha [Thermoleophilia bacterium]